MLLLLALAGCYEAGLKGPKAADTSGAADTGLGEDGEGDDTAMDSGVAVVPAWYTVAATLTVAGGEAAAEGASVTVIIVAEDAQEVVCEVALDPVGIEVAPSPSSEVAWWWSVPVTPVEDACAALPASVEIGIGALGSEVEAWLGASDLDTVADALYGAYIRPAGGEVYIYGWAGTEADATGDDLAAFPPPDGVYELVPIYLLSLD